MEMKKPYGISDAQNCNGWHVYLQSGRGGSRRHEIRPWYGAASGGANGMRKTVENWNMRAVRAEYGCFQWGNHI